MSTEQNKAIDRRFLEFAGGDNLDALDEVVAPTVCFTIMRPLAYRPRSRGLRC